MGGELSEDFLVAALTVRGDRCVDETAALATPAGFVTAGEKSCSTNGAELGIRFGLNLALGTFTDS
jgi:hypothetical protein